jgi:hypothetical protein
MHPTEASGLAFGMAMANLYDSPSSSSSSRFSSNPSSASSSVTINNNSIYVIAYLLEDSCRSLKEVSNLQYSGWCQFYIYQTLYCCDVEKPLAEESIKRVLFLISNFLISDFLIANFLICNFLICNFLICNFLISNFLIFNFFISNCEVFTLGNSYQFSKIITSEMVERNYPQRSTSSKSI